VSGSLISAIVLGVVLTAIAFAHPVGPGLMLVAETPFDAIPFAIFGVIGNAVTYIPIIIFLIKTNPAYWGQAFLGTRIQQYTAIFFVALIVCHAMAIVDKGVGEIFEWLRKATLFMLLGLFAYSMREQYLGLIVKVMVAAMAVFTVLSMMDFYVGIQLMPVKAGVMEGAAFDTEFTTYLSTKWRFTGAGYPVNRFSNYLLLVIFLGVGWFMHVKGPFQRLLALGCTLVLILGELFTVTRSGILGMGVGMALMLPMAFRFRIQQVIGVGLVAGVLGGLAYYAVAFTAADQVLAQRFNFNHLVHSTGGRLERIFAAFQIWAEHPFFGVGWASFKDHSPEFVLVGGKGAHNGYMNVLAEAGLLGFIPLMILTVAVVKRNLTRIGHLSSEYEFWRPYFFCGLVAQLVTNVFNDYLWERYLWVSIAFCVALEQCYHAARAKEARSRLEDMRELPGANPVAAHVTTLARP
jgi:hypothetical protein